MAQNMGKIFPSVAQIIASLGSDEHQTAQVSFSIQFLSSLFYTQGNEMLSLSFGAAVLWLSHARVSIPIIFLHMTNSFCQG